MMMAKEPRGQTLIIAEFTLNNLQNIRRTSTDSQMCEWSWYLHSSDLWSLAEQFANEMRFSDENKGLLRRGRKNNGSSWRKNSAANKFKRNKNNWKITTLLDMTWKKLAVGEMICDYRSLFIYTFDRDFQDQGRLVNEYLVSNIPERKDLNFKVKRDIFIMGNFLAISGNSCGKFHMFP